MELGDLRRAVQRGRVRWRVHALERMLVRGVSRADVIGVVLSGQVIEDYPESGPFPCALMLGEAGGEPLHAVIAYDGPNGYAYVVTAYRPDREHFEPDLRTRRRT